MNEIMNNIRILNSYTNIDELSSIFSFIDKEEYDNLVHLIDYMDWGNIMWMMINPMSDYFAECLIDKHEDKLMTVITISDIKLEIIEKYMNSKYMDIYLLILRKSRVISPEFASKYMNERQLEYMGVVNAYRKKR